MLFAQHHIDRWFHLSVAEKQGYKPSHSTMTYTGRKPGGVLAFIIIAFASLMTTPCHGSGVELNARFLQQVEKKYGLNAKSRVIEWNRTIKNNLQLNVIEKIEVVNDFFNRLPYGTDLRNWKRNDYWATPIEALGKQSADCEDYTIAKYITLREMGVPVKRLRIVYLLSDLIVSRKPHVALAYYEHEDATPLILDNYIKEVLPASRRSDIKPIYSFNEENIWWTVDRWQGRKLASSSIIKEWSEMRKRWHQQSVEMVRTNI
ncbi:MAG: transglutaminase-like cysteine peptidase [Sedimenticola sp.]